MDMAQWGCLRSLSNLFYLWIWIGGTMSGPFYDPLNEDEEDNETLEDMLDMDK